MRNTGGGNNCRFLDDMVSCRPPNDVDSTTSQTRTTVQPRSGRSAPVYCCNFEQLLAPWMARRPIPCPIHCHTSRSRDLSKRTYALPLRDNALVRHPSVVETSTSPVEVVRPFIGTLAVEVAGVVSDECAG